MHHYQMQPYRSRKHQLKNNDNKTNISCKKYTLRWQKKWMQGLWKDYRVVILSTLYLTVPGISMHSFKSLGQLLLIK